MQHGWMGYVREAARFEEVLQMDLTVRSIVVAWHGLPLYAARLLKHVAKETNLTVVGTDGPAPREVVESCLGQQVIWVDPARDVHWSDLNVRPPHIFIHTGWAYRAFNSLASEVKRSGGRVVSMNDNCWKGTIRQVIGMLVFRLWYRRRVDAVWVPGASGYRLMRFFGLPASKIYTGFYGADPTVFSAGAALTSRPKRFLFVGQLIARKAPDVLVRAFRHFRISNPEWELVLIGSGPMAERLSGDGISVLPFLSTHEIAEHMTESRFLVLPSFEEHWGVVVHEATLSGCGLVLSEAVGARHDLLTEGNGFMFETGNQAALHSCLCRASAQSEEELARIGSESLRLANKFGPEPFRKSFVALCKVFN